jgi:membrane protease YdiL (CAAX protease family)
METRKDPLRIAVTLAAFLAFYLVAHWITDRLLFWGGIVGVGVASLLAALVATWLVLRIYEHQPLSAAGLLVNRASAHNLAVGIVGGGSAAALVLALPLLFGSAHFAPVTEAPSAGTLPFVTLGLAAASATEELLFRGYPLQILIGAAGPFAAIIPLGVLFALMHAGNPHVLWLGIANTAGFGILFGYAFYRSRDLWLPIGLHFGWNFTLPLFGVNVSGLTIGVTGHQMVWTAGVWWSGGEYGPEASLLTSGVLLLLFAGVYKTPIRRQVSPLTDPPAENALCEPSPPLSS